MKILILASNPKRDLALDREIKDLQGVIKRSRNRDQLEVEVGSAVSPEDLQELLLDIEPQVVHFCGHGTGEQGLVLERKQGHGEQLVSTEALSNLFELVAEQVQCVVLNACYSEVQAQAISQHIPYVIGMSQTIRDDAAIAFSTGFYRALGFNRPIEHAYKFGCNAIQLSISGQSISRSAIHEQERKLEAIPENSPSEKIVIPEHLKPVLKRNSKLASTLESKAPEPGQATSSTQEIQVEVRRALEKEAALKHYRDQVRAALADGKITPDKINQLTQLATQLNLSASEASAILQEEQNPRPITSPPAAPQKASKLPVILGSALGALVLLFAGIWENSHHNHTPPPQLPLTGSPTTPTTPGTRAGSPTTRTIIVPGTVQTGGSTTGSPKKTCPTGTAILADGTCHRTCPPDNSLATGDGRCPHDPPTPPPCPTGTAILADGTCHRTCPPDNSLAAGDGTCPGEEKCLDGTIAPIGQCPPVPPPGTPECEYPEISVDGICHEPCPDGTIAPIGQCPPEGGGSTNTGQPSQQTVEPSSDSHILPHEEPAPHEGAAQ